MAISNPAVAQGAGAMISTLGDPKIWTKEPATGSLLQPAAQKLRLQTTVPSSNEHVTASYGLGILDIIGFLGHEGAILGYRSVVLYLPSRNATIVALSNGHTLFGTPTLKTAIALAACLFPGSSQTASDREGDEARMMRAPTETGVRAGHSSRPSR